MGTQPPTEIGTAGPHFWPVSIVAKQLGGSGYHLVEVGIGPGHVLDGDPAPTFWPTSLWYVRPSQQLLSCCLSLFLWVLTGCLSAIHVIISLPL